MTSTPTTTRLRRRQPAQTRAVTPSAPSGQVAQLLAHAHLLLSRSLHTPRAAAAEPPGARGSPREAPAELAQRKEGAHDSYDTQDAAQLGAGVHAVAQAGERAALAAGLPGAEGGHRRQDRRDVEEEREGGDNVQEAVEAAKVACLGKGEADWRARQARGACCRRRRPHRSPA